MLKIMTKEEKDETVMQIMSLVQKLANENVPINDETTKKAKMLTLKEGAELTGLSMNTLRELTRQNKIHCIRAGAGKNGKILISEDVLLKYISG